MQKVAIIVPCYNEANRLDTTAFTAFLTQADDAHIYFVDDGSTDNTRSILTDITKKHPGSFHLITLQENIGKANAVREGLITALRSNEYDYLGYLDADLSTSLHEFYKLYQHLQQENAYYIFGSRIKMLDTTIRRSSFRHAAGRLVATIIDLKLNTGIYDTQCGAKCFKKEVVSAFCDEPFHTRWLFDIEILLRIKSKMPAAKGIEKPLNEWINRKGSAITAFSFPLVFKEIRTLFRNYSKA